MLVCFDVCFSACVTFFPTIADDERPDIHRACLLVYFVVCLIFVCLILCVGTVCLILVYFVVRLILVCFVVCLNARVFDTWCFIVCLNACAFHIQLVAGLLRYKSEICVGHLPIANCQLSANCSNTDSNVVLRF